MKKSKNTRPVSKKIADIIMTLIFLAFIFGFMIELIVRKDRVFSEMENRNLAQTPKFSMDGLAKGQFSADLDKYISDQLFLRDELASLKTDCDRLFGKTYFTANKNAPENGIYFANYGYILQRYNENRKQIDENIGYLNDFAKNMNIPVDFILAPNAVANNEDKLPYGAVTDSQYDSIHHIKDILSDKISFYCPGRDVDHYKTDHHWTSESAKNAFSYYLEKSGQKENIINYDIETIPDFYGTLYSKAPSKNIEPDKIDIYSNPDGKYEVTWVNEDKTSDSIIDRSYLSVKDKYAAFFGGNFAYVNIKSNNKGEKVLVLKDSYANAMMQFMINQYSEINMIDLRYYHFQDKSVAELCKEKNVDRVIMIYNMDFINEDQNFIWLDD